MDTIGALLTRDLRRKIEEIIQVDQADEQSVHEEITEYIATDSKQLQGSSRRNLLPVERIHGSLLMGHEHLACAVVELMQIRKTPSGANRVLHHAPKAFDGIEVVPTMSR